MVPHGAQTFSSSHIFHWNFGINVGGPVPTANIRPVDLPSPHVFLTKYLLNAFQSDRNVWICDDWVLRHGQFSGVSTIEKSLFFSSQFCLNFLNLKNDPRNFVTIYEKKMIYFKLKKKNTKKYCFFLENYLCIRCKGIDWKKKKSKKHQEKNSTKAFLQLHHNSI